MTGSPLSDAKLDERELAWIGAGMAAGHLQQARQKAAYARRYGRKGSASRVILLEHVHEACEWLRFSARYKVLSAP